MIQRPPETERELTWSQIRSTLDRIDAQSFDDDKSFVDKARITREQVEIPDDPESPDSFTGESSGPARRYASAVQQARMRLSHFRQLAHARLWRDYWKAMFVAGGDQ